MILKSLLLFLHIAVRSVCKCLDSMNYDFNRIEVIKNLCLHIDS